MSVCKPHNHEGFIAQSDDFLSLMRGPGSQEIRTSLVMARYLLDIVREEEVGHRPPWTDPNCYRPTTKDEIKIEKITIKKYFVTAGGCNSFIGDLWNPSERGNNFPNFQESNWEFRSSEFGHFLWETFEENILKYSRQSSPYHCLYTQLPDIQSFKSHWRYQFISLIDTLMLVVNNAIEHENKDSIN